MHRTDILHLLEPYSAEIVSVIVSLAVCFVLCRAEFRRLLPTTSPVVTWPGPKLDSRADSTIFAQNIGFAGARDFEAALRLALDECPIPAWYRDADGRFLFGNHSYDDAGVASWLTAQPTVGGDAFERAPPGPKNPSEARRYSATLSKWFEISELAGRTSGIFGFAIPVESAVQSEQALERLRSTMVQTFAHLPVAVAIFDANKTLTIFNPALADILLLDVVWLARKPSLQDFLERLKVCLKVPELRDLQEWRRLRSVLDGTDQIGRYRHDWHLTEGRTIHVSAYSHSPGAAALMFEDVTAQVTLERQVRNEAFLNATVLNKLSEAIAIFDSAGCLTNANNALAEIWASGPSDQTGPRKITDLTAEWSSLCRPSPFWGELRNFVTGQTLREDWSAKLVGLNGMDIDCTVSPLPDGSTLVLFEAGPPHDTRQPTESRNRTA